MALVLAASFAFQVCGRVTAVQPSPVAARAASSVSASSCTKRQPVARVCRARGSAVSLAGVWPTARGATPRAISRLTRPATDALLTPRFTEMSTASSRAAWSLKLLEPMRSQS